MKLEIGKEYKDNFGTWWNCDGVEVIGPVKKYRLTTMMETFVISYYSIHEDGTEIWGLDKNIEGRYVYGKNAYFYRLLVEPKKENEMKFEVGNEYVSDDGTTWFCGAIEDLYVFLYSGNLLGRIEICQTDNIAKVFSNGGAGYRLSKITKLIKNGVLYNENSIYRKYSASWTGEALAKTLNSGESYVFKNGRLGTIRKIIKGTPGQTPVSTYLIVEFPYENKTELICSNLLLDTIHLPLQKHNGVVSEPKKENEMKICPTIFKEVKRQLELEYDLVKKKDVTVLIRPNTMFSIEGVNSKYVVVFDTKNNHKLIEITENNKILDTNFVSLGQAILSPAGYTITLSRKITIL